MFLLYGLDLPYQERERERYLPTSPGLTKPELALRQGTEAAVFNILGASVTMMGEPISNFLELPFGDKPVFDDDTSSNSHFVVTRTSCV